MKKILATAALSAAVGATALVPTPATAAAAPAARQGTTSLAEVLGADGVKFDQKWGDFDITEAAAYAVIDADPQSPVALLADGKTRLTAFIPTDKAFRNLVKDLTGKKLGTEKKVFKAVAGLGLDTVETVLLYHVVPGKTITAAQAVDADGASLPTALTGAALTVQVANGKVKLVDLDPDAGNAKVTVPDINKGNKQIAHGINKVLRPLDL